MRSVIRHIFKNYFEVLAFSAGLLLLAFMDPYTASGPGWCLFEHAGFSFCPGEGLGHSIAYVFRGEFYNSIDANMLGPLSIVILGGRIVHLVIKNHHYNNLKNMSYGQND